MEDISRIVDKELLKGLSLKSRKRSQNWDMFFVADDGKMFVIKKFKWFLRICAIVFIATFVSLVISAILLVRSEISKREYSKKLTAANARIEKLTQEKEHLLAANVIKEANSGEKNIETKNPEDKKSDDEQPEILLQKALSAGKVFMSKRTDSNTYKTRFRLTNQTSKEKPVNGYVFLILKKYDGSVDRIIPNVNLINEKPSEYRRGQYFSISRFKTVRFTFKRPTSPDAYKECFILAYSVDGKILLEKRSPLKVELIAPVVIEKPEAEHEVKKDNVKVKPDDVKVKPKEETETRKDQEKQNVN